MTDLRANTPLSTNVGWGWLLVYGIVSIVIGIIAFLWPVAATFAATWAVGIALIVAGIFAFAAGGLGRRVESRGYAVAVGILSLIVGFLLLFAPAAGAVSLTLLVAIWLGVRGILEIGLGARYRRHRAGMIVLGIINILLALYVLATLPWSALTLPGFVLGISFLFGGVVAIGQALGHRGGPAVVA